MRERGALPTMLGAVRSDGTPRLYAYGPEGFASQMTLSAGSGQGVGGFLLPGLTGLGHADEVYDLWRYADELPGASRFADDAVRHVDELVDGSKLLDNTDDAGRFVDDVEKNLDCLINSFSADTPVMTDAGEVPISQIVVGDRVLAYNEATGETGYYTVTAVIAHIDPSIVELTIDGDPSASSGTETLETTAEHPFYVVASAPWLATGESQGRWVNAGDLAVGDAIRQADGTTGLVQAVVVVERRSAPRCVGRRLSS